MEKETYIKSFSYLYENVPSRRKLIFTLSNGIKIYAVLCYESWQQWGCNTKELCLTMPLVEQHNEWLHGGLR